MLEKIRDGSTGIAAKVILGLVVLSFIFAGVGSYINSSSNSAAATVNSVYICDDYQECINSALFDVSRFVRTSCRNLLTKSY